MSEEDTQTAGQAAIASGNPIANKSTGVRVAGQTHCALVAEVEQAEFVTYRASQVEAEAERLAAEAQRVAEEQNKIDASRAATKAAFDAR